MPVGWWLAFRHGLGARGMWMGLIAGLSVAAVLLFTRFWRSARRHRWQAAPPQDPMTVHSQAVTLNDHL
jgi:MATE family multidrug resistance protein